MVDFDDATKYSPVKNRLAVLHPLIDVTLKEREIDHILYFLNSPSSTTVGDISGENARICAPEYFRKEFTRGFREGYQNTDKRELITHIDLHTAFGFR